MRPCFVLPALAFVLSIFPVRVSAQEKDRVDRYGDPLPAGAIGRIGTLRFWQGSFTTSLVFSRDGKLLLSGGRLDSKSKSIPCWDTGTGKLRRRINCQDYGAHWLALSPDGEMLASVSEGRNSIWLMSLYSGKVLHRLVTDEKGVTHIAAAFSSDGRTLASCGAGGVLLWDTTTGKLRRRYHNWGAVWEIGYSPNGQLLAGVGDTFACVGDLGSGKELWRVPLGGNHATHSIAFAPNGAAVATGDAEGNVRIIAARSGKELGRFRGHRGAALHVAFAPDGKTVASGGADGTIRFWDTASGTELRRLEMDRVSAITYSRDGSLLASGSGPTVQVVRIWRTADGAELFRFDRHTTFIESLAYAPDGKSIICGDCSGKLTLWDWRRGEPIREFAGHTGSINSVAFALDGKRLVSGCSAKQLRLWDFSSGKEIRSFQGHQDRIYAVAVSPDGKLIVSASIDSSIRLWDAGTGKELRRLPGGAVLKWVTSLAFTPNGRLLASGREDGTIHLCEAINGKEARTFTGHKHRVNSISVSSNGGLLASAGDDTTVRVWSLRSGKETRRLVHSTAEDITAVAFAPDGRTLVSGDREGFVHLWEVASGQELRSYAGHAEDVNCVAFAPDGRSVASGSRDFTVLVWDVTHPPRPPECPEEVSVGVLWQALASENAATAYWAAWPMIRMPLQSVLFLKQRLHPVEAVPEDQINRLVADLDSPQFAARESARKELQRLNELAVPALSRAITSDSASLELRRRGEQLLKQLQRPVPTPTRLRLTRALSILEEIKTPGATELMRSFSRGAEQSSFTHEARDCLQRLEKK